MVCGNHTVTFADLKILENPSPDSETGFYGVFREEDHARQNCYRARFGVIAVCEFQPSARLAAIELIKFWKEWFRDDWVSFWRAKKSRPFAYVPSKGGIRVIVFLLGIPYELAYRGRKWKAVSGVGDVLASQCEARAAYESFVNERYGLFAASAGLELRRRFRTTSERIEPEL